MRCPALVSLLLLVASSPARAAVLHVATNGSDASGDGSSALPWATIGHAVTQAQDRDEILVAPGDYFGRVRLDRSFASGLAVRSQVPYQARLRNSGTVVTCFTGQGILLEGFDIAHDGPGAGGLVIQVQDLIGPEPGGVDRVSRITLRNNVIHDSWNNDLLKVNNGASDVLIEGNLFYNQSGSDEHVDVNSVTDVVLQDNVFFNDFAASGRVNASDTSGFIVIKDSNAASDTNLGAGRITVRRNVFLGWEGSTGSNFVLCGEDGNPFFEAWDILVENNLMLGNSPDVMRAAFGVKGCRDVTFRANTVMGDLPSLAYAFRLNTEGANLPNERIAFTANAWSDPTGTLGAENPTRPNDFCDTPPGETASWTLDGNLYWNGGAAIPTDPAEAIQWTDDARAVAADPLLPDVSTVVRPAWNPVTSRFADGSLSIRDVFLGLVTFAMPLVTSPLIDAADPLGSPSEDILGTPRPQGPAPDIGAFEIPVAADPPPVELRAVSHERFTWMAAAGALRYDVQRGTLGAAGLAARGSGLAAYDHACFEADDAFADGVFATTDPSLPGPGTGAWYYLVAAYGSSGRPVLGPAGGDLDRVTPGVQPTRPLPAPCP